MRDKNRHTKHTIRMCIFCGGFLACSLLEPCLRVRRKIYNESVYWHVENIYYYNKNTAKKTPLHSKKCIIFAYKIIMGEYFLQKTSKSE